MREYACHKRVHAAPLARIENSADGAVLVLEGGESVVAPEGMFARKTPEPGDYIVRYRDGYLSWSPKKEFEDGYHLVEYGDEPPKKEG